jgi:hypothetical protein
VVAHWPDGEYTAVGILNGSPIADDDVVIAQLVAPWMERLGAAAGHLTPSTTAVSANGGA